MARHTDNRISYIKKPMASYGILCIISAVLGLVLCIGGMTFSIRTQGNTPLGAAAACFSGILFSVLSLRYGYKSFREPERNYILSKIGIAAGSAMVILCFVVLLIGIKG